MRENFEKSVREKRLPYVKKMKKWPKKRFTHTFFFHVGKKKTLCLLRYEIKLSPTSLWVSKFNVKSGVMVKNFKITVRR